MARLEEISVGSSVSGVLASSRLQLIRRGNPQ